ncbi:hypothetical protein BHE74_00044222 [Ensete ventricosum]|nr:hypothetical protein GW17_00046817 [Ensete ventricosum]RWW49586.1 hypothetical protein BHE74_00044222 [Ensete ventricosum]RZS14913.1 hypothetical protein BHM03_00046670 [Ensete ventricosum]
MEHTAHPRRVREGGGAFRGGRGKEEMEQKPVVACAEAEVSLVGDTVVREMAKIRTSTARLGVLLRETLAGNSTVGAVFEELEGSISRAFSLLDRKLQGGDGSPSSGHQSSEIPTKKRKVNLAGDRRGGCRRRIQSSPLRIVKSKTLDDGQTWRKYGQKEIQSAKHPRCTHKYDQGCMAHRQAQLSEDDPTAYVITYIGEHTCRDPTVVPPQMVSASILQDACLISFGAGGHGVGQEASVPASFASQKQESDEDAASNLTTASSSSGYFLLPATEIPVVTTPDVTSGFHTATDLHMDFMADTYLEDVFGFDDDEFFR